MVLKVSQLMWILGENVKEVSDEGVFGGRSRQKGAAG